MDLLRKYEYLLIFIKFGLAIPVCMNYASILNDYELVHVPVYIWILVLIYTSLQFLNKQINSNLPIQIAVFYYIGLLSVALPVFLVDKFQRVDWMIVAKIGSWFLVASVLWQMRDFMMQKNKTK